MMDWKKVAPVALVVVVLGGAAIYGAERHNTNTVSSTASPTVAATPISELSYKGQDGKTALEILKATYTVDVKTYSFGDSVQGINGHEADSAHYWAFYVNGKLADVGAGAYQSKSTDTIEWKYTAL